MARIVIKPNSVGYLFRNQAYSRTLVPGVYRVRSLGFKNAVYIHTNAEVFIDIINQEVLTKDSITLRLSYLVKYRIDNGLELIKRMDLGNIDIYIRPAIESQIHLESQILIRKQIAELSSQDLPAHRGDLFASAKEALDQLYSSLGVRILSVDVKDISFPKSIQDVFAKQLEAQIRSKADLENARTQIATARALKNAAEISQSDPNIRFFQWLETLTKIASKGNHTFVIGEIPEKLK